MPTAILSTEDLNNAYIFYDHWTERLFFTNQHAFYYVYQEEDEQYNYKKICDLDYSDGSFGANLIINKSYAETISLYYGLKSIDREQVRKMENIIIIDMRVE